MALAILFAKRIVCTGCLARAGLNTRQFSLTNCLKSAESSGRQKRMRSTLNYVTAAGVLAVGLSYAAVPLYRIFCEVCCINFFSVGPNWLNFSRTVLGEPLGLLMM